MGRATVCQSPEATVIVQRRKSVQPFPKGANNIAVTLQRKGNTGIIQIWTPQSRFLPNLQELVSTRPLHINHRASILTVSPGSDALTLLKQVTQFMYFLSSQC